MSRESTDVPTRTCRAGHDAGRASTDATVEALGKLSEALETCERARGHLYTFHQLTGSADIQLGDAVDRPARGRARRDRRPDRPRAGRPQRAPRSLDVPDRGGLRRHLLVAVPGAGAAPRATSWPAAYATCTRHDSKQSERSAGREGSRRPPLTSGIGSEAAAGKQRDLFAPVILVGVHGAMTARAGAASTVDLPVPTCR